MQSHWPLFLGSHAADWMSWMKGLMAELLNTGSRFMNLRADQPDTKMLNIGYSHCSEQLSHMVSHNSGLGRLAKHNRRSKVQTGWNVVG